MGDQLKPGGLGDPDFVGTPPEFAASMAEAMEQALNDLLVEEGKPELDTANNAETRDRRTLFLAIARGVVSHLVANHDAFDVTENDGTTPLGNHRVVIRQV